jgi:hypothetical protein
MGPEVARIPPPPPTLAGSVTIYAMTTVHFSPDSSMKDGELSSETGIVASSAAG